MQFKKEEKINGAQVDMALRSASSWNVTGLMDEFKREREEEKRNAEEQRKKLAEEKKAEKERLRAAKEMGLRTSKYHLTGHKSPLRRLLVCHANPMWIATSDVF